jgi:hypothetical protein
MGVQSRIDSMAAEALAEIREMARKAREAYAEPIVAVPCDTRLQDYFRSFVNVGSQAADAQMQAARNSGWQLGAGLQANAFPQNHGLSRGICGLGAGLGLYL